MYRNQGSNKKLMPNPDRFYQFSENIDGSGFVISEYGKEIEFFYDKYKGWFDEYGNYYNKNGSPQNQIPQDSQ